MEGINHRRVEVNGIGMHIAEKGQGLGRPVVLMLHGFPELWYSWRHQINGLADKGYHVVAPDLRGFGDTDAPSDISSYSIFHLVGDIVALIKVLRQKQVFVVGHDLGAQVAWHLCLFRPDLVKKLVNLGIPYMPRNPATKPVDYFRSLYGDDFYICRFQEPGVIEAIFGTVSAEKVLKKLYYTLRDPKGIFIPKKDWISPNDEIPIPNWFSEEDFNYMGKQFEKSSWSGGVNYYRCLDLDWELMAPWDGAKINVPADIIVGDMDITYNYPGVKDYIHNSDFKKYVPLLDEVIVLKGVAYFIQEEVAPTITEYILEFIQKA